MILERLFKKAETNATPAAEKIKKTHIITKENIEFKRSYIKTEVYKGDLLTEDICGIKKNLSLQWNKERQKTIGMYNDKAYMLGYTEDFGIDHIYIIDQMNEIMEKPKFMFSIDYESDKTSIYIHPVHRGYTLDGNFERDITRSILEECKKAFNEIGYKGRIQIDVDPELLVDGSNENLRVNDLGGLDRMIGNLR